MIVIYFIFSVENGISYCGINQASINPSIHVIHISTERTYCTVEMTASGCSSYHHNLSAVSTLLRAYT